MLTSQVTELTLAAAVPMPEVDIVWSTIDCFTALVCWLLLVAVTDILLRPLFLDHFDTVVVDWVYVHRSDVAHLATEAAWLAKQNVSVVVDMSSAMNLFPTARLCNNSVAEYNASLSLLQGVLSKMATLSARHLVLTLHRYGSRHVRVGLVQRDHHDHGTMSRRNLVRLSLIGYVQVPGKQLRRQPGARRATGICRCDLLLQALLFGRLCVRVAPSLPLFGPEFFHLSAFVSLVCLIRVVVIALMWWAVRRWLTSATRCTGFRRRQSRSASPCICGTAARTRFRPSATSSRG